MVQQERRWRRASSSLGLPFYCLTVMLLQKCEGVPVALPAWATAFKQRVHARQEQLQGRRFGADEFVGLRDEVSSSTRTGNERV